MLTSSSRCIVGRNKARQRGAAWRSVRREDADQQAETLPPQIVKLAQLRDCPARRAKPECDERREHPQRGLACQQRR